MAPSIYNWSLTAEDNTNADSELTWAEGQKACTINNSARMMMKRVAEFVGDINGSLVAGGTANGLTITANSAFTDYANGRIIAFRAASANTGAATLNVNGIGAKAIRVLSSSGDVAIGAGDIVADGVYLAMYSTSANSAAGGWVLSRQKTSAVLNGIAAISSVPAARVLYTTGTDSFTPTGITTFGRDLINDANANQARATLELGDYATAGNTPDGNAAPAGNWRWYGYNASGGFITITVSTGVSDRRLKKGIKDISGPGAFIESLKPREWTWNGKAKKATGHEGRGAGFVADEVEAVSPSSVIKKAVNDEFDTVDPASGEIMANVVAELQSLRRRLEKAGIPNACQSRGTNRA